MTTVAIVSLVIKGVALYFVGASLTVVGTAFVNSLLGGSWFDSGRVTRRWTEGGDGPCPALVFWLWPVAIPAAIFFFLGIGLMKATEAFADKARKIGEKRERQLRGATK